MEQKASNKLHGRQCHDFFFTTCYYSLYLRRVRLLIVRFFEENLTVFDEKGVTIGEAWIFTLIDGYIGVYTPMLSFQIDMQPTEIE